MLCGLINGSKSITFPELKSNSTLILDNAAFHLKDDVFRIAKQAGHKVLFLPPYSPDFNRIEQDFATRSLCEAVSFRKSFRASSKKDVFILPLILPWMTSLNHTEII